MEGHKQDASSGKHGVSSYVGLSVYVWEQEPGGVTIVSLVYMEKKQPFHM